MGIFISSTSLGPKRASLKILNLLCIALLLAACALAPGTGRHTPVDEAKLPVKLAVLPVQFFEVKKEATGEFPIKAESEKGRFVGELARGVIHNQLSGKGYEMLVLSRVDQKLDTENWRVLPAKALCQKLEVDGLVYPEIVTATMVNAVAYDLFKIDARVKMVNRSEAQVGVWQESAFKRKISLPTGVVGLTTTVVGALIDDPAKKQMRLVIYDWGYKVSRFVPDSPGGKRLPEVVSVNSNIDRGVFAVGDAIEVEAKAEKELTCSFDLGEFKQNLPMPPAADGVYKGVYVVQPGDRVTGQPLSVRLMRPNGVERVWMEAGASLTIDGVLPPAPEKIAARAGKDGVLLSWDLPRGEELKAFVVEKSAAAVGEYTVVTQTRDLQCLDSEVAQGQTYYYRVSAIDAAGNRSTAGATVPVTLPFFDEVPLTGALSGKLVPGLYRLEGQSRIAPGSNLVIGTGTTVTFAPEARLIVDGSLQATGLPRHPIVFKGRGWKGIRVTARGQAELTHLVLKGCSPCLETGGNASVSDVSVKGDHGDGLVVKDEGILALKGARVSGFERAIAVAGGKAAIEESTISGNTVGLDAAGGEVSLRHSNLFDNTRSDFRTRYQAVLEGNYLGATSVKALKLEGDILVKSLLDAPYPHGRRIVLVDEKTVTPEILEKRFEAHKRQGIDAFAQRRFGDAYQQLTRALDIRKDPEVYLYLAYTQSSLGEEDRMARTLEQGIAVFPYEVRLYPVYVKYLLAHGQTQKAAALLEKAIKMNPDDRNLLFMRQYVGEK